MTDITVVIRGWHFLTNYADSV